VTLTDMEAKLQAVAYL